MKYLKNIGIVILIFSFIWWVPNRVSAAPTYVTSASYDDPFPADGSPVDNTFDSTTFTDGLLIVVVTWRNSAENTISAVSFNSDALTSAGSRFGTGDAVGQLWYLKNPDAGSFTLRVDPVAPFGSGEDHVSIQAYVYSNVDQTTPTENYTTNEGNGTTYSLTVTSASGDTPFYNSGSALSFGSAIAESNYTERQYQTTDSANEHSGGEGTGAASVAFSGTTNGIAADWVALGLNMNATAGGGGAVAETPKQEAIVWFEA